MSGGSMDYLYCRLKNDSSFQETTSLRKALRERIDQMAAALRSVEWNDSGDGDSREDENILRVLSPFAVTPGSAPWATYAELDQWHSKHYYEHDVVLFWYERHGNERPMDEATTAEYLEWDKKHRDVYDGVCAAHMSRHHPHYNESFREWLGRTYDK